MTHPLTGGRHRIDALGHPLPPGEPPEEPVIEPPAADTDAVAETDDAIDALMGEDEELRDDR